MAVDWVLRLFRTIRDVRTMNRLERRACRKALYQMYYNRPTSSPALPAELADRSRAECDAARILADLLSVELGLPTLSREGVRALLNAESATEVS